MHPMRNAKFFASVLVLACVSVFGQTQDKLTFEVASVKRTPPPEPGARVFYGPARGGPGSSDPGQITWANAALRNILMTAYAVQTYQITAPEWMNTERYDIVARVPAGATKAQVNLMWQNLLKERFRVVLHHESKEFQVDDLTVAKGGSKLKETDLPPDSEPFSPAAGPPKLDKSGAREMNGYGSILTIFPGANGATASLRAKGLPSSEIAIRLAGYRQRPVIDKTGLTGRYDFTLDFTLDMTGIPLLPGFPAQADNNASDPGSDIASAVEKQLGLKLTPAKGKLDVIVVDRAEKTPTEN
jgi:uncharacterized protein (TIGR03435 family)